MSYDLSTFETYFLFKLNIFIQIYDMRYIEIFNFILYHSYHEIDPNLENVRSSELILLLHLMI